MSARFIPVSPTTTNSEIASGARQSRDLRFDTVRGVLLIVMALNHVDSDLRFVVDQPFGFVSAAEGFVFLSGLMTGRLDAARGSNDELSDRAFHRARRAYLWHAVCLFFVWLWVQLWLWAGQPTPWKLPYLFFTKPWAGLCAGLGLLYQPGMLDILPMYVGFPFIAVLVVRFHRKGKSLHVWLLSGMIWALDQWLSPPHPIEWGPINTGAFHFLSWQWLFVSGVLLGSEPAWEREALRKPKTWTLVASGIGAAFLFMVRRPELPDWWAPETLSALTQKTPLAAVRLLNFGLLAYILGVIGSRKPTWLVARPLALLGRHSLPVFTASIWSAQIAGCYPEASDSASGRWVETVFVLGAIFLTALACEKLRTSVAARNRRPTSRA